MSVGIADFNEFYRRYAPDVFRFAMHLAGNHADAEDITSETFVRVWAAANRVEAATVKGYLLTIARNLHLKNAARQKREVALDETMRDVQATPLENAESRSDIAFMNQRLAKMPEIDRSAFLLRTVNELPYEEIARTLGISLAAAKVKVHRARRALSDIP